MDEGGLSLDEFAQLTPEYAHSSNRILDKVIRSGLWDSNGEERVKDVPQLIQIIEAERAKRPIDYEAPVLLPDVEELQGRIPDLLQKDINKFLENGIITQEMVDITSKLTGAQDIQITRDGSGAVNYTPPEVDDITFPVEGDRHIEIGISKGSIENKINYFRDFSKKVGMDVAEEVLTEIALRSIISHEWAHSLEKALGIEYYQRVTHDDGYNDESLGWEALRGRSNIISRHARGVAPAIGVHVPKIESEIHSERLATGFEFESTKNALEEAGIEPQKASQFIGAMVNERSANLKDFRYLREQSGLSDFEIWELCADINKLAQAKDIPRPVKQPWSDFGYDSPYSGQELKIMLADAMQTISDPAERIKFLAPEIA